MYKYLISFIVAVFFAALFISQCGSDDYDNEDDIEYKSFDLSEPESVWILKLPRDILEMKRRLIIVLYLNLIPRLPISNIILLAWKYRSCQNACLNRLYIERDIQHPITFQLRIQIG